MPPRPKTAALAYSFALLASVAWAQTDPHIVPLFAVAPPVVQIGISGNVLFTVLNANPNSTQQIQPGDAFTFSLNVMDGSIQSLGAVTVNGVAVGARDGAAVTNETALTITATEDAELVLVETEA